MDLGAALHHPFPALGRDPRVHAGLRAGALREGGRACGARDGGRRASPGRLVVAEDEEEEEGGEALSLSSGDPPSAGIDQSGDDTGDDHAHGGHGSLTVPAPGPAPTRVGRHGGTERFARRHRGHGGHRGGAGPRGQGVVPACRRLRPLRSRPGPGPVEGVSGRRARGGDLGGALGRCFGGRVLGFGGCGAGSGPARPVDPAGNGSEGSGADSSGSRVEGGDTAGAGPAAAAGEAEAVGNGPARAGSADSGCAPERRCTPYRHGVLYGLRSAPGRPCPSVASRAAAPGRGAAGRAASMLVGGGGPVGGAGAVA